MSASTIDPLLDMGELDEASELAKTMLENLQDSGDVFDLLGVRTALVRIMALRGEANQVVDQLDWLESTARTQATPEDIVIGLGSAALARASVGQADEAIRLLHEVDAGSGTRNSQYYPALLPAMVRTAVSLQQIELATRLVTGVDPTYPYTQHALLAAESVLTEARGDNTAAIASYAEAADRLGKFGVVPERAFALLGQGRCLIAAGRASESSVILDEARDVFYRLGATPSVTATDAVLAAVTGDRT